jgi:DNA-binding transcriptional LysR family regulator
MQKMNVQSTLASFDVGQLKFLQALLDTSAITRAGDLLGLSQPGASRVMNRLRKHFGDPLLVRTAQGYVLTPVAELLRPLVRYALDSINTLFEVAAFDARTSTRAFRIASTDYGMSVVLLPQLLNLRQLAPLSSWQVEPWSDLTISRLERGELDCALYSDEQIPPDFHHRKLFDDGYSFVCRPQHPLTAYRNANAKTLLREAAKFPQCAPRYLAVRQYVTDNLYIRLGLKPANIVLASPYFHTALEGVIKSDLVSVVPDRLARTWEKQYALTVMPINEKTLRFEYRLIWHERAHRDRGLQWFKAQFARDDS